ncbi:hypothetical protein FACS1894133_7000 [Clostridia bacterium]|nr:hypothetical protein FACS1894133_7000 [Clostridia bacterium]
MAINYEPAPQSQPVPSGKNVSEGASDEDDDFVYEGDNIGEPGDDPSLVFDVKVKVFGVGGGGGNAVEHMAQKGIGATQKGIGNVELVVINTDVPALQSKDKKLMRRIQIGKKTSKGRGAGGNPTVGAESALEERKDIEARLRGTSLVFITAGMGGGSGTGAAPVIAEIAKEMGILTIGVVTKPFDFEGSAKMNIALKGIAEMRKHVDSLVIIPNEKLLALDEHKLSVMESFKKVDDVLYDAVSGITEILSKDAFINVDFSDIKTVIEKSGDAHIAISSAKGDKRVTETVQQIVNCPLLETTIANAGRLLVNVTANGNDFLIPELNELMSKFREVAHQDVIFKYGFMMDETIEDGTVNVTLIATDFAEQDSSIPTIVRNIPATNPGSAPKAAVPATAAASATRTVAQTQPATPLTPRPRQTAPVDTQVFDERPNPDILDTQPLNPTRFNRDSDEEIYDQIDSLFGNGNKYRDGR